MTKEIQEGPVAEIIDQVFTKTSPKRSFSVIENERFGLVFAKTGSINSGTGRWQMLCIRIQIHTAVTNGRRSSWIADAVKKLY